MDVLMSWITAFLLGTSVYRVRKNAEENGDERKEDSFSAQDFLDTAVQTAEYNGIFALSVPLQKVGPC